MVVNFLPEVKQNQESISNLDCKTLNCSDQSGVIEKKLLYQAFIGCTKSQRQKVRSATVRMYWR